MILVRRVYHFEWLWAVGVTIFVISGSGDFFCKGLLVLLTLGRDCQFGNEYLKGVLNFVKYLDNGYKKY